MFIPSERNWQEMAYEPAGCWPLPINGGREFAIVIKMPASVIKAAYRSCPVTLSVARAETAEGVVLATTFTVADDPASPLMLSGVLRHAEEQLALENILRTGTTLAVFFDELSRVVARAACTLGAPERAAALTMVDAAGQRYIGAWTPLLSEVLDEVQGLGDPELAVPPKHSPAIVTIPLSLSEFQTQPSTTVGLHDALAFRLDGSDEGRGLEQSTWHLLEHLFEGRIHHSPQVPEGRAVRELTDILVFCDDGICFIETKAAAVLTTNPERATERRAKSVQKQIDKGVNQLRGAMRNLAVGRAALTKSGLPIALPATAAAIRHGLVMVSEMVPTLDWEAVGAQLLGGSRESGAMLHVIDLSELRILVGISRDDPAMFMAYLCHRFDVMAERKHAMLRTRLDGPALP